MEIEQFVGAIRLFASGVFKLSLPNTPTPNTHISQTNNSLEICNVQK